SLLQKFLDLHGVLDAGGAFQKRAGVDAPRRRFANGFGHVRSVEASGDDDLAIPGGGARQSPRKAFARAAPDAAVAGRVEEKRFAVIVREDGRIEAIADPESLPDPQRL